MPTLTEENYVEETLKNLAWKVDAIGYMVAVLLGIELVRLWG